jgi:putative ABC transport system permease protein
MTSLQIAPILAALRKHRLATLLIALEIALACAVLCNACFLIANRLAAMNVVSGVDESSLALLSVEGFDETRAADLNARIVAGLRAIPGMDSVSVVSGVPFGPQVATAGISLDASGQHSSGQVDFYVSGPGSLGAMGLRIVAGQAPGAADYTPVNDFVPADSRVLVTRALAAHLWPKQDPLGKEFWVAPYHFRVIGIVDHLTLASPGSRGLASTEWAAFVPGKAGAKLAGRYLLRAPPQQLAALLQKARTAIATIAPDAVLDQDNTQTVSELRQRFFQPARIMAGMLTGVILALLLVTALGIVGLASFWVAQRRRQIGIRRAIGATRRDILRYFQVENFLIVTLGIVLGMGLAYGLNALLMQVYELPRLPLSYLPIGAAVLWLLGQLAVLGPALRAAAVPPVVATRSI